MVRTAHQLLPADVLHLGHTAQPPPTYQRHQRVAHAAALALRVPPVERRTDARHAAVRLTHINIWCVGHVPCRLHCHADCRLQRRTAYGCRLPTDTQRDDRGQRSLNTHVRRVAVRALPLRYARQVAHRTAAACRPGRATDRYRFAR